jgi:hypothetical protein
MLEMWTILAWILAAAISALSLKYFTSPYAWIFLAGAVAPFVTAATDAARRALWFNVACLSVGLGIFEFYLWTTDIKSFIALRVEEGNAPQRLFAPDGQLGWAPQADTLVTQKLSFDGELLYATYTIGPNGLRISSPSPDDYQRSQKCVLFFGDSFTFGQGLGDHETLPFRVHAESAQQYWTYNFGVNGYGAHQMLSALQQGLVRDIVQCERTQVPHVFYQAITDHVFRAAGRDGSGPPLNGGGPRYVLTQDGGVRLENTQNVEGRSLIDMAEDQKYKLIMYRRLIEGRYTHEYDRKAINTYLAIVDEARKLSQSQYPSAEFHVILWDKDDVDNRAIRDGLRQRGINVHLISDILPNYEVDDVNEMYVIHERDFHPNALANEIIARYLIDEILGPPPFEQDVDAGEPAAELSTKRRLRS